MNANRTGKNTWRALLTAVKWVLVKLDHINAVCYIANVYCTCFPGTPGWQCSAWAHFRCLTPFIPSNMSSEGTSWSTPPVTRSGLYTFQQLDGPTSVDMTSQWTSYRWEEDVAGHPHLSRKIFLHLRMWGLYDRKKSFFDPGNLCLAVDALVLDTLTGKSVELSRFSSLLT